MRPLRALAIYIAVIFLGGAMLAPPAYWALHGVVNAPFHRYLNRCFLLLALIGIWPMVRAFGIRTWSGVGLRCDRGCLRSWSAGFGTGIGTLLLVAILALLSGVRRLLADHSMGELCGHLFNAGLAAMVVSILEEILFRGAVFGALRVSHGWKTALVISSAVFGLMHFLDRVELHGSVQWTSGLELLPGMLRGFAAYERMIPAFLNLALVGAILALAYERTGNLYFSIGLHGGWIFAVKTYGFLTTLGGKIELNTNGVTSVAIPRSAEWVWGSDKLIDGWVATGGLLVALLLVLWRVPAKPKTES